MKSQQEDVFVDYEYGTLKEVIVGVPLMIYPDVKVADWAQEALKILPESEKKKVIERSGKSNRNDPKFVKMEKENQELIKILKKHNVKVWRPEVLSDEQLEINLGKDLIRYTGVTFQYSRDPIFVIGDNIIELHLASLIRVGDILAYYKIFLNRVMDSNAKWYSMPKPNYSELFKGGKYNKNYFPLLEGGDLFALGKKVLVGTSMNTTVGSSELGYKWLKSILQPQGYDVERVRIAENFLHLDLTLSTVKPGLAIACKNAFVDGLPEYFKDWKIIEVSVEEAQLLATNGMPIDIKHYIMPYNEKYDGKRVQKELEAEGIIVYPISYGNHTEDGGAIRCSTHPLIRKMK